MCLHGVLKRVCWLEGMVVLICGGNGVFAEFHGIMLLLKVMRTGYGLQTDEDD